MDNNNWVCDECLDNKIAKCSILSNKEDNIYCNNCNEFTYVININSIK